MYLFGGFIIDSFPIELPICQISFSANIFSYTVSNSLNFKVADLADMMFRLGMLRFIGTRALGPMALGSHTYKQATSLAEVREGERRGEREMVVNKTKLMSLLWY